jgi:DNA polymerase-3 subunit epsilon
VLAEIGRCCAPCVGDVDPAVYQPVVEHARAAMTDGSGPVTSRLLDLIAALAADERYQEAGWRRDRLAALVDAVRRQRVSRTMDGIELAAYRPVDDDTVDLVVVSNGRMRGSARCSRAEAGRVATEMSTAFQREDDDPFVIVSERELLSRWLALRGTVLLWSHGSYADTVAGGAELDRISRQLRRRRKTPAPASELTSKRLRREVSAAAS